MMTSFLDLQRAVQLMMESGRVFEDVEDLINDSDHDLSEDERSALWLWAWSLLPHHRQRVMALRYLESLEVGLD
jgi:hypothetical protein